MTLPSIYSWAIPSAFSQYSPATIGTVCVLLLCWFFLGIAIISDIFMDGIGVITSQYVTIQVTDALGY